MIQNDCISPSWLPHKLLRARDFLEIKRSIELATPPAYYTSAIATKPVNEMGHVVIYSYMDRSEIAAACP